MSASRGLENLLLLVLSVAVLGVAAALVAVLLRLRGTLAALEQLLITSTDEVRQTLPEVRQALSNANDVTAAVNAGLRAAGTGLADAGTRARARWRRTADAIRVVGAGLAASVVSLSRRAEPGGSRRWGAGSRSRSRGSVGGAGRPG